VIAPESQPTNKTRIDLVPPKKRKQADAEEPAREEAGRGRGGGARRPAFLLAITTYAALCPISTSSTSGCGL